MTHLSTASFAANHTRPGWESRWAADPVAATHDLRPDPTHDLSSVYRETCTRCGRAALRYRSNEYGSALEVECDV